MQRGFAWSVLTMLFVSVCFWPAVSGLAKQPSTGLLQTMATIGATLLVAYAVESAATTRGSFARTDTNETWLGVLVGAGAVGLLGIALALALGERANVGHWNTLDDLGFAIVVGSLLFLALILVLMPWFSHEWSRIAHFTAADDED
jgi:NADH:ubiquinone oxidoreductase subunit 6 (subunit J)